MPDWVYLADAGALNLTKTFECGQCFRWNLSHDGVWSGAAGGHAAMLCAREGAVYIASDGSMEFWRAYFDLERDYTALRFEGGEYLQSCISFGEGIRILKQDSWEALCSFIISQRNNIPRIKGIVDRLCREFGREIECGSGSLFSFPDPETLAALSESDLLPLRCGYRAEYIITAARAVSDEWIDLNSLRSVSRDEAITELKKLRGVGDKVANCVALYGLGHLSGFPVDVWMARAIKERFPPGFNPDSLGEYAGIAQQYIFYYERSGHKAIDKSAALL